MFTGLIEQVGIVESVAESSAGREIRIRSDYEDLVEGESVAVNGACLTVLREGPGWFTVAAIGSTLGRTAISDWGPGSRLNLERALRANSRLGGHIVQGHVDGVASVRAAQRAGESLLVEIELPGDLVRLVVPTGSVAVDGVSLTVNAIDGGLLQLALIEYTLHHTALGDLRAGSRVHIEADVIGKYVQRLMSPYVNP